MSDPRSTPSPSLKCCISTDGGMSNTLFEKSSPNCTLPQAKVGEGCKVVLEDGTFSGTCQPNEHLCNTRPLVCCSYNTGEWKTDESCSNDSGGVGSTCDNDNGYCVTKNDCNV